MEKISVVIPIYNVEKYINDCVDSLLAQKYENFEAIFVDDGSKDDSINLLKAKVNGKPNFKIVTKTNGGLSSARNFGLEFAEGEFVTFLDSDDYLSPDYLTLMLEGIGDADICCCGYREVSEEGGFIRDVINDFDKVNNEKIYNNVVESIKFIPNAWGKLYRKTVFNKLHYPEGMLFEDYAIAYKVFYKEKTAFVDLPLYFYRIRSGSIMRDYNPNIIEHKFIILEQMKEFLLAKNKFGIYRKSYENSYIFHGLFVTSCIIINQKAPQTLKHLKKITQRADKKIFSLFKILKCESIDNKIKLYLLLLRISPSMALFLKLIQNKVGR